MIQKLLIATNNKNKLKEIQSLFANTPIKITSLAEVGINHNVEETGITFEENAILKAIEYSKLSNLPTLADDSGLMVDALDGRPGVYSSRYAGENATDQDNWQKLLQEMKDIPDEKRTAKFIVVMAIATPDGKVKTCEGTLEGLITKKPKGNSGFGYDPVFYVRKFNATLAEITQEQKNQISHRKIAIEKAIEIIKYL